MQSQLRLASVRAARTVLLPQRRLLATPPSLPPSGIPPVPPAPLGATPVRPVVVTAVPITPGSSTLADRDVASSEIPPPPPTPPKRPKKRYFRRFVIYTTLGLLTFYPLSGFLSTKSENYREFFISTFPLGEDVAEYADDHAWESFGVGKMSKKAVQGWQGFTGADTPASTGQARDTRPVIDNRVTSTQRDAEARVAQAKKEGERALGRVESGTKDAAERVKAGAKEAEAKAEALARDVKAKATAAAEKTKASVVDLRDRVLNAGQDASTKAERAARDAKAQTKAAADKAQAEVASLKNRTAGAAQDAAAKASAEAASLKDRAAHAAQDIADRATAEASSLKNRIVHGSQEATHQAKAATTRAEAEAASLKDRVVHATQDAADKAKALAKDAKDRVIEATSAVPFNVGDGLDGLVREAEGALSKGEAKVKDVVHSAEAKVDQAANEFTSAKAGPRVLPDTQRPRELRPETVKPVKPTFDGQSKYAGPPLPLGFEPPPGYYIPPPVKAPVEPAAPTLPLLAPKVQDFATDEPIISQLASTIDSLTSSLSAPGSGASTDATGILSKAQGDLTALSQRLAAIKKTEKEKLEKSLSDKTQEFETTLKNVEASKAQAEQGIKDQWQKERATMVADWRKDMEGELESQREGIEKRLREEVVSQGIELQRRWLRSIKTQVETERGGRLAKLDNLTTSLKELEQITLDNSATLDQNVRLHKVWSALRAVQTKAEAGDVSFDNELRVLKFLSSADTKSNSPTAVSSALAQLEQSGIAQTGVKSLAALSSWFTNSVSPRVQSASLVPAPENAGVASHVASLALSKIMFRPTPGPVDGSDVSAVLARAEWCLSEKDLDGAAREVNRLSGWPKRLASDWLREARRALEVRQALEVVATDATLRSLLLV